MIQTWSRLNNVSQKDRDSTKEASNSQETLEILKSVLFSV